MTVVKTVADGTFNEEVLSSTKPVLVDFWASWCPPCLAIAPHIAQFARDHADVMGVVKLNIEENQLTPMKYQIRSIPTLLLFQNGEVKKVIQGFRSKSQLEVELADFI